jgi:hypothetical protein
MPTCRCYLAREILAIAAELVSEALAEAERQFSAAIGRISLEQMAKLADAPK